jgi:hypothetical protein
MRGWLIYASSHVGNRNNLGYVASNVLRSYDEKVNPAN